MCGPIVMEAVQRQVDRRGFLRAAGTAVAAAAVARLAAPAEALAAPRTLRITRMQDLTHTLKPTFPTFSGQPALKADVAVTVKKDGYYGLNLSYWEHVGTHMDAPAHFGEGAPTVDQVAVGTLFAPVAVVHIHERAARDPDTRLTVDDLRAWERRYGRLPRGAAVFMHSGWERRAGSAQAFRNPDAAGVMHFPGFHPDAAAFLLHERDVVGIGVDTLSLDFGASKDFKTHTTWLPAGRWGLENLANLAAIPPAGAWVFVGAPKVVAGSGGPTRVVAIW
ncbi:MAG: cyclase family protein [Armatimonadota bacterium]|nr:cyclase family protein [Armatimonadota bacterium]MDR7449397.1 cyclase family protein [Armatimonadota bacterium]MDR7459810.1 cyclase family protein [Armatimonadota bacterium]MDR7480261.1 cyclase family protein [Armatimonadota bacterium]MDR7488696.1 cyclase family protein [Armatimonadota bacterium]